MNDFDAPVSIYALLDASGAIRYVGKSAGVETRIAQHKRERGWLKDYIVLEVATRKTWVERERYWIAFGREHGWPLENRSSGGDGTRGIRLAPHHRQKIAAALAGNKNGLGKTHTVSEEARRRMSSSAFRRWTPEACAKHKPRLGKSSWMKGLTKADPRVAALAAKAALSRTGKPSPHRGKRRPGAISTTSFKAGHVSWNKGVKGYKHKLCRRRLLLPSQDVQLRLI